MYGHNIISPYKVSNVCPKVSFTWEISPVLREDPIVYFPVLTLNCKLAAHISEWVCSGCMDSPAQLNLIDMQRLSEWTSVQNYPR